MTAAPNMLDHPLFYPVDPGSLPFAAPDIRLGDATRLAVRSLSVMQKEALVVSARTGRAWRLASDEGAYLDGHDVAPCPLSFLSAGMAASYMEEMRALAAQRGIALGRLRLIQDNHYTMKGSARDGSMTGGAKDIGLEAQVDADAPAEAIRELVVDAVAASPLNGLMRAPIESRFTLAHNGRSIANGRALPVPAGPLADPGDFGAPRALEGRADLIERTGRMTPANDHTETFAGGSLSDRQDRLLHVRVFAESRADGIKEIVQYLYNPHGTVFRYLSSEDGRAPDALSLISAGIGFCFMTQFGRYAKIMGRPFTGYRIVQDAHLSLGGATGGTGLAGTAQPLETHCFLESGEDDAYARQALDMAEQTCFLHALCKAALRARVRIAPYDAGLAA